VPVIGFSLLNIEMGCTKNSTMNFANTRLCTAASRRILEDVPPEPEEKTFGDLSLLLGIILSYYSITPHPSSEAL